MGILAYVFLLLLLVYIFLKYVYSYWNRKGFRNVQPKLIYGNFKPLIDRQRSFGTLIRDLYWESVASPYIGIYLFFRPALLIRDVNIVKRILTTDNASFYDRGTYCNKAKDPMSANLFTLRGREWKELRTKMTPLFSSGQLKNMFPTLLREGENFADHLQAAADANDVVEMKDKFLAYSLNVIASVFFGLDVNVLENPKHRFAYFHRLQSQDTMQTRLRQTAMFLCPQLLEYLNIQVFPPKVQKFFTEIILAAFEARETDGLVRKDFMQLFYEMYKAEQGKDGAISIEEIAAQVFIFYVAGTETTSGVAGFCLYELCQNQEIMNKVCKEIEDTLKKYDGQITYEAIQEMSYLELCVKETMRKVPGLAILNREATKDYKIEETGQVIKKGTAIVISVLGMQNDPQYFKDPERFMPERFLPENSDYVTEDAYTPFGDGPRACIAVRMGKIGAKVALVTVLSRYVFQAVDNQKMEFAPHSVTLMPKAGINLKLKNRLENNNTVKS